MPESVEVSPSRVELGKRVSQLRIAKNLTQQALADASGLQRTYVAQVEQGRMNVTLDNLTKLADALGVKLVALFDFEGRIESLQEVNKQWAAAWSTKVGGEIEVRFAIGPTGIELRGYAPPRAKPSHSKPSKDDEQPEDSD